MTLSQMKPGPVKSIVERELRDFVNQLEEVMHMFEPVSQSPVADAIRANNRMLLDDIEMLMKERGITRNEQP